MLGLLGSSSLCTTTVLGDELHWVFSSATRSRNVCILVTWATLHYMLDWFGGSKQTHYSCQLMEFSLRLHLFVYVLLVQTHPYFFRHLSNDDDSSIGINKKFGKHFFENF